MSQIGNSSLNNQHKPYTLEELKIRFSKGLFLVSEDKSGYVIYSGGRKYLYVKGENNHEFFQTGSNAIDHEKEIRNRTVLSTLGYPEDIDASIPYLTDSKGRVFFKGGDAYFFLNYDYLIEIDDENIISTIETEKLEEKMDYAQIPIRENLRFILEYDPYEKFKKVALHPEKLSIEALQETYGSKALVQDLGSHIRIDRGGKQFFYCKTTDSDIVPFVYKKIERHSRNGIKDIEINHDEIEDVVDGLILLKGAGDKFEIEKREKDSYLKGLGKQGYVSFNPENGVIYTAKRSYKEEELIFVRILDDDEYGICYRYQKQGDPRKLISPCFYAKKQSYGDEPRPYVPIEGPRGEETAFGEPGLYGNWDHREGIDIEGKMIKIKNPNFADHSSKNTQWCSIGKYKRLITHEFKNKRGWDQKFIVNQRSGELEYRGNLAQACDPRDINGENNGKLGILKDGKFIPNEIWGELTTLSEKFRGFSLLGKIDDQFSAIEINYVREIRKEKVKGKKNKTRKVHCMDNLCFKIDKNTGEIDFENEYTRKEIYEMIQKKEKKVQSTSSNKSPTLKISTKTYIGGKEITQETEILDTGSLGHFSIFYTFLRDYEGGGPGSMYSSQSTGKIDIVKIDGRRIFRNKYSGECIMYKGNLVGDVGTSELYNLYEFQENNTLKLVADSHSYNRRKDSFAPLPIIQGKQLKNKDVQNISSYYIETSNGEKHLFNADGSIVNKNKDGLYYQKRWDGIGVYKKENSEYKNVDNILINSKQEPVQIHLNNYRFSKTENSFANKFIKVANNICYSAGRSIFYLQYDNLGQVVHQDLEGKMIIRGCVDNGKNDEGFLNREFEICYFYLNGNLEDIETSKEILTHIQDPKVLDQIQNNEYFGTENPLRIEEEKQDYSFLGKIISLNRKVFVTS